ncbi:hypothetical protein KIN20_028217 [Parelaphostrongylus tenuis]|uniref:Uncharacterized protein n=1 Tax=Parelaphostrongylus tenuis TaxID=148309 RepID=A0AAD5R0X3_PARTN|nr:hypothetical protein KIN20_028217 [Parelaphostrongylus tenuis]
MVDNREKTRRMEDVLGSAQFVKTNRSSVQALKKPGNQNFSGTITAATLPASRQ